MNLKKHHVIAVRGLTVFLFFLVLEIAVAKGTINPLIIARPTAMILSLYGNIVQGEIPKLFLTTMTEVSAAFGLAALIGFLLGYFLWRYEYLGLAYETLLGALFASPLVLVYPIFLVIFGRSPAAVVAMGTLAGFIPITLGVRDGLAQVNRTFIRVGKSLNLSNRAIFWRIQLPAATPTIFSGLRLGFTYTLVNVIGVEFLAEIGGLGKLVSAAYFRFQIDTMYGGILTIIILTGIFIYLTYRIQGKVK